MRQRVIEFVCEDCPLRRIERCSGPLDGKTYLMQGDSLVSCVDTVKREKHIVDVYSRYVPIPASSHQHKIKLPPFIPDVRSAVKIPDECEKFVFGISLGRILTDKGKLQFRDVAHIKRRFGIPEQSQLVLIGTGKDIKLEALWKTFEKRETFERIAQMGFAWATSASHSVWTEMPRADQILNQERNFQTHDMFANLGMPTIPFLFPVDESDFAATKQWLLKRPDIDKIAVYGRYYKNHFGFDEFFKYLHELQSVSPNQLQFLVVGTAKKDRIEKINRDFDATIVTSKPFIRALAHQFCGEDLEYYSSDISRERLIVNNLNQYEQVCSLSSSFIRL